VVTGLDTLKTIETFDGFEFALLIMENASRLLLSAPSFHQDRISQDITPEEFESLRIDNLPNARACAWEKLSSPATRPNT